MIGLILSAALLQGTCAPQWRAVHRSDVSEVAVDPASLRRDGQRFEITARVLFHQVTQQGLKSGISRHRYNCARQSITTLHVHFFDANGRTIENRPATGAMARDRPVGGGTAHAAILRLYCPRRAG